MPSIIRRLEKVEEAVGGRGGCPTCWNWDVNWDVELKIAYDDDPEPEPTTCTQCGRQPKTLFVRRYVGVTSEAV